MKNLRLLGLVAIAAMAPMAFAASSASATVLYNGSTKLTGALLDFSLEALAHARLTDTSGNTLDDCAVSTVKGNTKNTGSATETVKGTIGTISWESCTFPTSTVTAGSWEFHWTSGTNGTITSASEIGVTINTVLFGSCVYGVKAGANLGVLTTKSSGVAVFDANATVIKLSGGGACPETAKWTANYYNTSDENLRIELS